MGMAFSSMPSHSSFTAFAFAAPSAATASASLAARVFGSTTSTFSFAICVIKISTSPTVLMSSGFSAFSSVCIVATCVDAEAIFCNPISYRDLAFEISARFARKSASNDVRSSKYDVGVT